MAFRNNGYRIPTNDTKFVKQEDVSLGAPAWKKQWPKDGIWPGAIADRPPIALRLQLDTDFQPGGARNRRLNFNMPNEFALYSGGTLGDGISFFGELEFKEGNIVDLSLAFINFDHLFGTPLFNIRMGRFEPAAAPFSRFYRRMTASDYNVSDFLAVTSPSPGSFRFTPRQQGIEIWGARTGADNRGGFEYSLGVFNGNDGRADTNTRKDFEWSLGYKFFGYGLTGPIRAEVETLAATDNFIDNSFKVGMFGVVGRRDLGTGATATEDRYHRIGIKFDAFLHRLNLYGAYALGRDRVTATKRRTDSSAWFLEADYVLTPWIVPLVRYEKTDITELAGAPRPQVRRIVPAVRFAIRANVALLVEGRFFVRDDTFAASLKPRNEGKVRVDFLF
jgi:hypothetical protein